MKTTCKNHLWAYLTAGIVLLLIGYALPHWLPGDFVTAMYADSQIALNAVQQQELRDFYTTEENFGNYLKGLFTLRWGYSRAFLAPVSRLILDALPWTLLLMGSAHLLSTALGFLAGVEAAWRRGTFGERAAVGMATVLEGIPELVLGSLLLLVFALDLGWLPAAGGMTAYGGHQGMALILDIGRHLALPLATLFAAWLPGNFLLARASMVTILKAPFLNTARGKGLPALRIRYAHAARNALLPLVTRFALRIAFMVTGALVVETLFAYPGLGTLLFQAIGQRDLPLIRGIVLFSSLAVLSVNLLLEQLYGWLDPRVNDDD